MIGPGGSPLDEKPHSQRVFCHLPCPAWPLWVPCSPNPIFSFLPRLFPASPARFFFFLFLFSSFFFSILIRRRPREHQPARVLLQGLPNLQDAGVAGEEERLAGLEALDVVLVEAAGDAVQARDGHVDGALGGGYAADAPHEGVAAVGRVLEAQPQAARGDVGRRDGLGVKGQELLGRGGFGPRARHRRQEARAVQGQGEEEVALVAGERRQPHTGAGAVLDVRAGVDDVVDAHFYWWGGGGGDGGKGMAGARGWGGGDVPYVTPGSKIWGGGGEQKEVSFLLLSGLVGKAPAGEVGWFVVVPSLGSRRGGGLSIRFSRGLGASLWSSSSSSRGRGEKSVAAGCR